MAAAVLSLTRAALGGSAMEDAKFWRIVAVVVCVGLFYVGHGLHDRGGDGLPSLANVAHAGGVAVDHPPEHGVAPYHLYTTDATGTLSTSGRPTFLGSRNTLGLLKRTTYSSRLT